MKEQAGILLEKHAKEVQPLIQQGNLESDQKECEKDTPGRSKEKDHGEAEESHVSSSTDQPLRAEMIPNKSSNSSREVQMEQSKDEDDVVLKER